MRFSKAVVAALLIFLAVFTVTMCICAFVTQYEPSTLIACVFAFAGVEGGALAMIKIFEKENNKNDRSDNNSSGGDNTSCGGDHSGSDSLDQEQNDKDSARAD